MTTRTEIQWQDQHGRWHHLQTMHHQPSAFLMAQKRARTTGKRHRLLDQEGRLLDLMDPN